MSIFSLSGRDDAFSSRALEADTKLEA